jgi:hypothetical protein
MVFFTVIAARTSNLRALATCKRNKKEISGASSNVGSGLLHRLSNGGYAIHFMLHRYFLVTLIVTQQVKLFLELMKPQSLVPSLQKIPEDPKRNQLNNLICPRSIAIYVVFYGSQLVSFCKIFRQTFHMKSIIFWNMTPCSLLSCNRRFRGTYRLQLQGRRSNFSKNQQASRWQAEWRRYVPPKRRLQLNRLHGVISQKMILFITTAVKTSNPTFHMKVSKV